MPLGRETSCESCAPGSDSGMAVRPVLPGPGLALGAHFPVLAWSGADMLWAQNSWSRGLPAAGRLHTV